jgi:hypothetical protein
VGKLHGRAHVCKIPMKLSENFKKKDQLRDLGAERRTIVKLIFRKQTLRA